MIIHLNLVVLVAQAYRHCTLLYTALKNRRAKNGKVASQPVTQNSAHLSVVLADMGVLDPSRIDSQPDQSLRIKEAIKD